MHERRAEPASSLARHLLPGRKGRTGGPAGLRVHELRGLTLASVAALRGKAAAIEAIVRERFGCELPAAPVRREAGGTALTWVGPGRWLAIALDGRPRFAAELAAALEGHASVIDQTGGLVLLRVAGPDVREVLAKGLTIDLHPRAFAPLATALTTAGHVPVQITRLAGEGAFELAVPRSYAASFWHWLEVSAAAHGIEVGPPAGPGSLHGS